MKFPQHFFVSILALRHCEPRVSGAWQSQLWDRHVVPPHFGGTPRDDGASICLRVFLTGLLFFLSFAAASSLSAQPDVDRKIKVLEERVKKLTAVHTQILEKQSEIKRELASLKMWIHRRG